jgi:hypothetical protein
MKLHALLSAAEEAQASGDIAAESPVFAVVRNDAAVMDSPDAWHAISIVDLVTDPEDGSAILVADARDTAADMEVASLHSLVRKLPSESLQRDVFVGMLVEAAEERAVDETIEVVEAYGDENGLGLMLWFEGYETWLESQD